MPFEVFDLSAWRLSFHLPSACLMALAEHGFPNMTLSRRKSMLLLDGSLPSLNLSDSPPTTCPFC